MSAVAILFSHQINEKNTLFQFYAPKSIQCTTSNLLLSISQVNMPLPTLELKITSLLSFIDAGALSLKTLCQKWDGA